MPGGSWGQTAAGQGVGAAFGASRSELAPANTYDPVWGRSGGNPAYYGPSDGNTQKRQFAQVGKLNLNLLDPLAAERAANDYVPIDPAPQGPLGGLGQYYSPSTPGGFFAGILGALGSLPGQVVSTLGGQESGAGLVKAGSDIGTFLGKTLEAPLTVVGGVGLDSIPFVAPVIDAANSAIEANSPYILRDTLKVPKNIGGAFQSLLNMTGLLGRAVERTYAGMANRITELPPDIQERLDSGELTRDQALDELVMTGRGFTNDPIHNMVWSMLTDPVNWLSLGVGAVAGAAKGTTSIARVFSAAATREGSAVARLAGEAGEVGDLVRAAQAGEVLTEGSISRSGLQGMRRAVNSDLMERVANGEEIPNKLKLSIAERAGMSALGPVRDSVTEAMVFRVAQSIARATDPINFFAGSKAGQRSMEQLHIAASTGVIAALGSSVVRDLANVADDLVSDGGLRIMEDVGTWGGNAMQEFAAHEMASDPMKVGGVPKIGSFTTTEASRQTLAGGAYDTNIGKYIEANVEKTKDIRVATLPPQQMYNETTEKLAAILGVSTDAVRARVSKVNAKTAMAVHGLYYYRKGKALHTDVAAALGQAVRNGTLPKDIRPDRITLVKPRTLTNLRVKALEAALKTGKAEDVRAITENFDDFNWMNRQTVADGDLIDVVRSWLEVNRSTLPEEVPLFDPVTGRIRPDIETSVPALAQWAEDSDRFGYGLANGMPQDAPLEAQWRLTHGRDGKIINANPWLDFWAEDTPIPARVTRWNSLQMAMTRSVRGERILWDQRRRFITDMSSEAAGTSALPPAIADRIFKALMYEAQQGRLLPRGMSPDQMMDAAGRVLKDARDHSGSWSGVGGKLTERQIVTSFLRAMEGDVGLVGVTQKLTGRIKSGAPGAGMNYWGQLSERLYPLMRFTLNPVFMSMEFTEGYILDYMRGIPLPLRRSHDRYQQGLATHNAVRQFIFASQDADGLMAESMEMYSLKVYQAAEAKTRFGARTLWGKVKGSRPAIAERKQAAAGLQARQLIGENLYRAFKEIKGAEFDDFWGRLEYEYGTVSRAEIADRWLSSNLSLQNKNGHQVLLSMDLMNPTSVGQRLRLSTDGSRPGDYTYGDVEELLDAVREYSGEAKRGERGLKPGDALIEDLKKMTPDQWQDEVQRAGLVPRVGRISDSQANDIWRLANGPDLDPWWKAYRDTYLRLIKGATPGATRKARDQAVAAARSMVQAAAKGKNLTEEEFVKLHFEDVPKWSLDAGIIPPNTLTDVREDLARAIWNRGRSGFGGGDAEHNLYEIRWAHKAGEDVHDVTHRSAELVSRLMEDSANRDYLYVPINASTHHRLRNASLQASTGGYGDSVIADRYDRAWTDPVRAVTHSAQGKDMMIRVRRDTVYADRMNVSSLKRPKSHDYTLGEELTTDRGVDILTPEGWRKWDDYVSQPGAKRVPLTAEEREIADVSEALLTYLDNPVENSPWKVDFTGLTTAAERQTSGAYEGITYTLINSFLRGEDYVSSITDDKVREMVGHLDSLIQKGVLKKPMTLFRGINPNDADDPARLLNEVFDLHPGDTYRDAGFMSSTDHRGTAETFADTAYPDPGHIGIVLELDVPAGMHANLIEGAEAERLIARGTDWEVLAREDVEVKPGVTERRIKLRPISAGDQTGVNRLMLGEKAAGERNTTIITQLAHSDPAQLRTLVGSISDPAMRTRAEAVAERAISEAEAARPGGAVREVAPGRRVGPVSPTQALDHIEEVVSADDITAYRDVWTDLRKRIEQTFSTTDASRYGLRQQSTDIFLDHDTRALAGIAAGLPSMGGVASLNLMLSTIDRLWVKGIQATISELEAEGTKESEAALLMTQHWLRGIKEALPTTRLPSDVDDSLDVVLGNRNRRATGRTDELQPIVADDAAYEGAGYVTPQMADELGLAGAAREVPSQPLVEGGPTTFRGDLGGSTGATLVEDSAGRKYVEKQGASPGHIAAESYADTVYTALGVAVPEQTLMTINGRLTKRANFIEGGVALSDWLRTASPAEKDAMFAQISDRFALDALLANWDAIGLVGDNILIKDGLAYRVDNGGSFAYRAQGGLKNELRPGMWGEQVGEVQSLRNPSINQWGARVYGALTDGDIRRQVDELAASRATIMAALPPELQDIVGARLDDLIEQFKDVEPTAVRGAADTIRTEASHAYLVQFYNDMAGEANTRGLGGWKQWTAADMAVLAGRAREEAGRPKTAMPGDIVGDARRTIASEVYFPPGSPDEWMNPLLDLLNRPENRAARHTFMSGVYTNLAREIRDAYGLIIDATDDRGIGIWDGAAPQPLVPLHILSGDTRGDELADLISYIAQQAEVWHYKVAKAADVAGKWDQYEPRLTIVLASQNDAEDFAVKFAQTFPTARGATAIQLPGNRWQISMIDRDGSFPRLNGKVDEDALAVQINETLNTLPDSVSPTDAKVEYGSTYVAGPEKLPDGTYDWAGHRDTTLRRLQERGVTADASVLDRIRSSHSRQLELSGSDAAPHNFGRARRREPLTDTLEDNRGGQVFGTTTPTGASASLIRGFGNADPLTGLHELIHVFSIAGMDSSLREVVSKDFDRWGAAVEQKIAALQAKADATTNPSTKKYYQNRIGPIRDGLHDPVPGQWGKAQEEFFVQQVMTYIDRGVAPDPEMAQAFEHFRNWLQLTQKQRTVSGMPPMEVSPQMKARLDRFFSRPGVETVPYSPEHEVMRQAGRQVVRNVWDETHATHYYKRDRSALERSINHPYIGLYPASYMWGKVLPEMVRFLALRPFGMTTPFLGLNVAREVGDTIRTQSETDPTFKKFLKDNEDMFMFMSMFFPALPQDIPANASLPLRRVAEQGLENEQRMASGLAPKDIEYARGAQDAIQYAVGPLGTIRTASDIAGMGGELLKSVFGGSQEEGPPRDILPLR